MESGDCPTLNMNAKENYLFSQSLTSTQASFNSYTAKPFMSYPVKSVTYEFVLLCMLVFKALWPHAQWSLWPLGYSVPGMAHSMPFNSPKSMV